MMNRAKEHLGKCGDTSCRYCSHDGLCMNGMRNTIGCEKEDPAVKQRANEVAILAVKSAIESYEDDPDSHLIKLAERRAQKIFNFVYRGHEYRASDSARAQNTCPHCGMVNPNGMMFKETDTCVIYIGTKDFGNHVAKCFECQSCFKKFYYHL